MNPTAAISVRGLHKSFGQLEVLSGIDGRIRKGEVVCVIGPSGSGKSSTSRGAASKLGLRYLDTGAMFRAMTWWMIRMGVDVHDPAAVAALVDQPDIRSGTDPVAPSILVDGVDLFPTQPVRSLACRVYSTERGYAGAPTPSQIEEALHETYR